MHLICSEVAACFNKSNLNEYGLGDVTARTINSNMDRYDFGMVAACFSKSNMNNYELK